MHPTAPELRRVLADALKLGRRLPRGAVEDDLMLVNALRQPHVLVLDEAQLSSGADDGASARLVGLHGHGARAGGGGSERALRRVPALASRVLTWELVLPLRPGEVAEAMVAFHPLWQAVSEVDVVWVDNM